MYESCATCPKLGDTCRGPRLTDMTIAEAIALMKSRKKFLGWSNQQLGDRCHTPKGTIDGIFAAAHADFRYETIRPVWNALFCSDASGDPCPDMSDGERGKYEAEIIRLGKELENRDKKIQELQDLNGSLQTLVTNTNARTTVDKDFLREQIRNRNKAVTALSVCLGICLLVIIGALIVDRLNPGKGFFWLRSWLGGSGWMQRLMG